MKKRSTAIGWWVALGLCGACSASTTVMPGADGSGGAGAAGTGAAGAGLGSSGGSDPGACPAGEDLAHVAPDESAPSFIALDATHVYWSADTAVRRAPRAGGAVETLAGGQPIAMGLTVDESFVYWAMHDDPGIRRAPKGGGPWVELAADIESGGAFAMVAVDATHLYARGGCADIVRLDTTGGPVEPVVSSEGCIGAIALDAEWLYYAAEGAAGAILRVPKEGGVAEVLVPAEVGASGYTGAAPGLAVDAEHVVWMSSDTGRVLAVPKAGGEVRVLATGVALGQDVVTDGARVYWSEKNAVRVVGIDGGPVVTLVASPQLMPMGLALGAHHLFFTNYVSTGPVTRVCR
ncbi:MAG: hypothetical protein HY908_27645 [Myxococcales bacterium]|nr:hypothetical protein [Myxococcales bacterium]